MTSDREKAPQPVDTARGAEALCTDVYSAKHTPAGAPRQRRRRHKPGFAAWMQTEAPHALGLHDESVRRIARCMARPEARGVTSLELLIDSLRWLRAPFYSDPADPLAWQRFTLAARALWWAWRGRLR